MKFCYFCRRYGSKECFLYFGNCSHRLCQECDRDEHFHYFSSVFVQRIAEEFLLSAQLPIFYTHHNIWAEKVTDKEVIFHVKCPIIYPFVRSSSFWMYTQDLVNRVFIQGASILNDITLTILYCVVAEEYRRREVERCNALGILRQTHQPCHMVGVQWHARVLPCHPITCLFTNMRNVH